MARPTVTLDTVIDAAPSVVFAVLADWRQNTRWEQELLTVVPVTDEPVGVGSRYRWERLIGRRRIGGESVITAFEPGKRLVTEVPTGPVGFRSVTTLAPTADVTGTQLHAELTQRPRGLLRLLAAPMAHGLRKRAIGNLQALQELVEREATAGARARRATNSSELKPPRAADGTDGSREEAHRG